jgi:peptide/nickel transport system ATP-binding protein
MSYLLEVKNLTIEFTTPEGVIRAVDNISFKLNAGETLGIVGESGSGKSVSALAVMRLLSSTSAKILSGEILFEGVDLLKLPEDEMRKIRGNKIGMIFQEPMTSLNPVFTVGAQIAESLILHFNMNNQQARTRTLELMNLVGIPDPEIKIDAYPHELSGGQKQRIMIAMSIACGPKLLIADEPTTALDVTIQKQVLELMHGLQKQYGMGMLFITHDLGVIADIADDVFVMYRSKEVEFQKTKIIFKNPTHPYTKGLISCRPRMGANPKRLQTVSDFMNEDGTPKNTDIKIEVFHKPYVELALNETPILEINNLETYFPVKGGFLSKTKNWIKAVDGVSFKIKKGKTFGLVGESGCGKTTLGRSILRLIEPTAGQIIFQGNDITKIPAEDMRVLRKKMQIIFQDPYSSLNPRMTIADIIKEPMDIHHPEMTKKQKLDRCLWLLDKVGLKSSQMLRYPHEFSGGQRQRICIARALTLNPEFIICDESVSALDVSVQAQVLNLLLDLQDEFGLTYIFISHDLGVVNFIADDVAVMNKGKIIEMGRATEIYKNPSQDYTKRLLSSIPRGYEIG